MEKQLSISILLFLPLLILAQDEQQTSEAFDPNDDFEFQMKKPKILVKGHVVCDQCGLGRVGNTTLPLHDAEVRVKCTDLYGFVTFSGVGYSDTHGVFTIPMDEIPAILGVKGCKAKLLRGPSSAPGACDVVSTMGDGHSGAPLQLVHKSLREVIFTSGPFACRPSKFPQLCSTKSPPISRYLYSPPPPAVPRFHAHTPPPAAGYPVHTPPPAPSRYKYQSPPPPPLKYHNPSQPPRVSPVFKNPPSNHHPPPVVKSHPPEAPVSKPPPPASPVSPPPASPVIKSPPKSRSSYKSPPPPVLYHKHPPTPPPPHKPVPAPAPTPKVYKYASPPPPTKASFEFGMKQGKSTVDAASLPDNDMNN